MLMPEPDARRSNSGTALNTGLVPNLNSVAERSLIRDERTGGNTILLPNRR